MPSSFGETSPIRRGTLVYEALFDIHFFLLISFAGDADSVALLPRRLTFFVVSRKKGGEGSVYKRGSRWWIRFFHLGKQVRRAAPPGSSEQQARDLLRRELASARLLGTSTPLAATVADLMDLKVELGFRAGKKGAQIALYRAKAIKGILGAIPASGLTTSHLEHYVQERLNKVKNATVKVELQALRHALRLGCSRTPPLLLPGQIPSFPVLPPDAPRQGFLEGEDLRKLLLAVKDPDLRDFLQWFSLTGMRPKEIASLTWDLVSLEEKVLLLSPGGDKIGKGRGLPLEGELLEIILRRATRRQEGLPLVFHRWVKGRWRKVDEFYAAWRSALAEAGLPPGLRPYDLRRTAIRRLVRAGVSERVVMSISGHRTRSTFDRYNITSLSDIRDAFEKLHKISTGETGSGSGEGT